MKLTIKTMACTLGIVAVGLTSVVSAQQTRTIGEMYRECGLGAVVFGGGSETAELLAVISNITSDLGSTAITSGLVSPTTCSSGSVETAAFIIHTYPSLERDLARGEGEYVNAMLEIRDCDSASHQSIVADMRAAYLVEPVGDTPMDRASALFNSFENTLAADYSGSCVI